MRQLCYLKYYRRGAYPYLLYPLCVVYFHSSSPNALDRLYWCLLEVMLTLLDPPNPRSSTSSTLQPGLLHLVACEHLLRSDPGKLSIPTWLVTRLQSAHLRTSRPVQLLRLFWKFDRVEEAYTLAMNMLDAANGHNTADPATFGLQVRDDKSENLCWSESKSPVSSGFFSLNL